MTIKEVSEIVPGRRLHHNGKAGTIVTAFGTGHSCGY